MSKVIYKMSELQNIRKAKESKEKYYVISNIDINLTILQTKTIDDTFLHLYEKFLQFNPSDFLIVKDISALPQNADMFTLQSLIDLLDSMKDADNYDELRDYIVKIL